MAIKETNVVKTFTLNAAGYGKKRLQEIVKKAPKDKTVLFNVLALVTGYKVETNKKDSAKSSLRFEGTFEMVDVETGEEIMAASAFIPGPAEAFLKSQIDGAGEAGSIRQAIQLTVETDPREDSATGYKFGMKGFVNKESASDPFGELRSVFPEIKKLKK